MKRLLRLLRNLILYVFLGGIIALGLPRLITEWFAKPRTYSVQAAPEAKVAIVFGAGLRRDGSPTAVLRDRVETASELYFAGKVQKLLMSGDNRFENYNEPGAMRDYAFSLGVPADDIVLDFAGRRSYDTCYRARHIFHVDDALLITQGFHLPRVVFTCNALGVRSQGVLADRRTYSRRSYQYWRIRELPATLVAMVDVWVTRPLPVLGTPEPIFSDTGGNPYSE